jgi:hypothetical protein
MYGCVSSIIIESALISTGTIAVYGLLSVLGERYPSWGQPCAHLLLGAAPQAVVSLKRCPAFLVVLIVIH